MLEVAITVPVQFVKISLRTKCKRSIQRYGQCYDRGDGQLGNLIGPFFCGMSVVLKLSQFNMFIHSPFSTSIHLEVAMVFSGEEGMILELQNDQTPNCRKLEGFDVSWVSRYKEEDERYVCSLFIHTIILLNSLINNF